MANREKRRVWMIQNEKGEYLTLKAESFKDLPDNFSRSKDCKPTRTISVTEVTDDPFENFITVEEYNKSLKMEKTEQSEDIKQLCEKKKPKQND